ncbi:formyl transferase [Rheinheimera sp. MMS21-TC3]|uniref:formyl transferase n=1 Tax=Rheinheimera sp. MMS21-TC3 TaxID=3072790 RepID=UPI0028C4BCDC|nr:formyl transferase [Rheinheimera sp. MMS21-TC3]WNO61687.1 formyl transferase [Rheinheimera sp. MMS21-TC3]
MRHLVVLGRASASTQMLIQTMTEAGFKVDWVEERRDDKKQLLLRRIKKQGLVKVFGQVCFMLVQKYLSFASKKRRQQILAGFHSIASIKPIFTTTNVNSADAMAFLASLSPDIVILSGTRILSPELLAVFSCPVINIHAGINPKYRGVHGGYWALVNKDAANFGSTIHRVDTGIDTGDVLAYAFSAITSQDNFATYPLLQQKAAMSLLPKVVDDLLANKVNCIQPSLDSQLWSHPTLLQYLINRFKAGVK